MIKYDPPPEIFNKSNFLNISKIPEVKKLPDVENHRDFEVYFGALCALLLVLISLTLGVAIAEWRRRRRRRRRDRIPIEGLPSPPEGGLDRPRLSRWRGGLGFFKREPQPGEGDRGGREDEVIELPELPK